MSGAGVAYNPNDPLQQAFLSALALGETGGGTSSTEEGYGGIDLSGAATDSFGFPQWTGANGSHAAGTYQFEPGTWDSIANEYGLNFQNPSDQNEAAWYEAQQTYQSQTGQSLEDALETGASGSTSVFSTIQNALKSVWPSVTGNAANPAGLANALVTGEGAPLATSATSPNVSTSSNATVTGSGTGWIAEIENIFLRFGLIIIGGLVVIVALYFLLSAGAEKVASGGSTARDHVKSFGENVAHIKRGFKPPPKLKGKKLVTT